MLELRSIGGPQAQLFSPAAAEVDRTIMESIGMPRDPEPESDDVVLACDLYMRRLEVENANGERRPIGPPDPDKLARHVKLYGSEGVDEAVRAWPVASLPLSAYKTDAPSGRRMTAEMERVIMSFGSTHPLSAIANTLNLSQRRVKDVLALSA